MPKVCVTCGGANYTLLLDCDRCINKACTPYEDMPQDYKYGVKMSAQKLSDAIDAEILKRMIKEAK